VEAPIVRRDPFGAGMYGFSGLGIDYLKDLQQELGFTCVNIKEYAGEGELLEFKVLTRSFADCAVDGDSSACKCDVGVAGVAKTPERLPNVDYVAAFVFDTYSVAVLSSSVRSGRNSHVIIFAPYSSGYVLHIDSFLA
jgi:hypothetical protein